MGYAVALDGPDAWIGAFNDSEAAAEAGAAYLFRFGGTDWVERSKMSTAKGGKGVDLGTSMAAADGVAAAGAPNWNAGKLDDNGAVVTMSGCTCDGDFNGDGMQNVLDFVGFQLAWVAKSAAADCDRNGNFNVLDFVCFTLIYNEGCP